MSASTRTTGEWDTRGGADYALPPEGEVQCIACGATVFWLRLGGRWVAVDWPGRIAKVPVAPGQWAGALEWVWTYPTRRPGDPVCVEAVEVRVVRAGVQLQREEVTETISGWTEHGQTCPGVGRAPRQIEIEVAP